ncbi:MAG: subtilisin family serine protease, partial [Kiritimatiellia bacterium]
NASINLTPPPRAAAPAPVLATTQPSSIIPKVTRKEEPRINRMIENGRTVEQRTFLSSDGQMEIVQTLLETHHKYPLIRIHRSYQVNEDGTRHLHEEYAAPVDHLLVQTDLPADDLAAQLPAGLKIQSHLRTQGAYVIKLPEANLDSIDTGLAALASLAHAEPDYMYYLNETVPNDAQFPSQAAMQNVNDHDIDAPEAWDIQTGSSNIVVAIIDTGMDYNHPDLAPNIWNNPAEALGIPGVDDDGNGYVDDIHGWDFYFNDADPFDDSSHGTHVAGIIGAVGNNNIGVAGVNWQIRMAAVKAFSIDNAGFTSDIVEAMAYTRIMGFDIGYHAYGTHVDSPFLTSAIDELGLAGQIFVTLAGGTEADIDLDPYYPASHPGDHVIVATTSDTEDHRPYWANTGALSVDLAAPGVDILSTLLNGSYGRKSGVSMSGAFVAGACALLKAQYPASDSGAIKARLLAGVDPLADFQGQVASHGRLNLHRAISIASPPRAPTAPDQLYSSYNGLDEVDLDWNDNSDDEIEFAIERKQGFDGTFVEIGRSDADQPFYIDLAPIPGVENIYRVKALGAVVDSGYSNELVIDLPPPGDVWDPLDDNPANGTLLSGSTSTVESVHGVHSLSSLDTVDWFTIQLDEGETYQFSLESLRGTEVRMIVYYPGDFSGGPELISFGGRTIMHYQAEDSGLFNIAVRVGAQANSATYNLYYSRVVERNPPSIFILQPEPGDIWPVEQGRAEIVAQVTEIDHTVEHVEFYANGTLFATDALTEAANGTSLHTVEYVFTTPGPVELMAIVHDAYGLMATSEVVQVEVATPPRVEIVNPIAGLSRPVGVPVLIETEVDVPAGQRIVESRIIQRSKNIVLPPSPPVPGQVNETIRRWYGPPEDINWIPAHLGELDLFAEVTFSDGRTTQSAPVPITLTNAIAVQITSPIDGIYTNTSTLTFAAEILGQTQQVDEVRFIFDGDLIGVFHQPPYTLEWTNTTPITAAFSVIAFITNVPPSLTFGRVDVDLRYFPTNPTNLIAQFLAPASTELHWVDTSSNEVGFEIEQSTDGTNFTLIATVDANQTSFEAETVTPNQDYYHRVRAINESGESPYSNIARIETSVATQPISGEVIYTGAQTGFVHVVLYKLPGLTVLDETVLTAPGSFTFPNQKRFNEYRISAFIDADLSSQLDFFEARGQTPAFMVDDPVTNLVIQLVDPDSDDDRLPDYEEIVLGTNPHEPDSDFDDAWDGVEVIDFPCLDPMDPDTDGDGIMDGVEIASDSDPCDPNDPLNENHGISGTVNYGGTYQGPVYVGAFTDDALAGAFLDDFEEPALDPGWIAFGFGGATTVGVSTGETASGTQALTFRSEGVGAQEAIAIRNFPHPVMSGSISWWHYDNVETARHSVFMSIGAEDFTEALSVNLYDVTFDDLYYEVCGDGPCSRGAARSTGWHEYVVTFTGGVARLSIDGVFAVESREFAGGLASVSMVYVNDHNGVQEARFDLLQTHNATIRYQTMLAGPGAFNLSELPGLSTYELRAFMD